MAIDTAVSSSAAGNRKNMKPCMAIYTAALSAAGNSKNIKPFMAICTAVSSTAAGNRR
ncbi:hypothetical protein ACW5XX_02050 [Aeromonas mytilicola]|uniref:hypothetical protein n=1 Tax=Aeromonas rivipollensis TaxID=948519 RepID=UPI0038D13E38